MPLSVRLLQKQYVDVNGTQTARYPGDWVTVGKQQALLWLAQGIADIPAADRFSKPLIEINSGVLVVGGDTSPGVRYGFSDAYPGLGVETGRIRLAFERTCIWNPQAVRLRYELLPAGLALLDVWQIAVPLWDYKQLACQVGSAAEQERTKAVIHDLRVPLYDTRLLFVRREPEIERLFQLWQAEVADGADEKHAFLRVVYQVKPFILALPTTWCDPNALR